MSTTLFRTYRAIVSSRVRSLRCWRSSSEITGPSSLMVIGIVVTTSSGSAPRHDPARLLAGLLLRLRQVEAPHHPGADHADAGVDLLAGVGRLLADADAPPVRAAAHVPDVPGEPA